MTLQSSGTISMNDIHRELKGYTASGTLIDLNNIEFRKMATAPQGYINSTGAISLTDFYGDRSHIKLTTGSHNSTTGSSGPSLSIIRYNGYIKDFFGSGSHLGSLSTSAGVYIPSSGDTSNSLTEREVTACYTRYQAGPYGFSQRIFQLSLAWQIYPQNTFTGIQERSSTNSSYGQYAKALSAAQLSTSTSGNGKSTWTWFITSTSLWTNTTTRYIHWY